MLDLRDLEHLPRAAPPPAKVKSPIFSEHLKTENAQADLEEAIRIAKTTPSCLLCFEHSPDCCHRLLVAEAMSERTGQKIVHLDIGIGDVI